MLRLPIRTAVMVLTCLAAVNPSLWTSHTRSASCHAFSSLICSSDLACMAENGVREEQNLVMFYMRTLHCKKKLAIFLFPAGMSLTGKSLTFFYSVIECVMPRFGKNLILLLL